MPPSSTLCTLYARLSAWIPHLTNSIPIHCEVRADGALASVGLFCTHAQKWMIQPLTLVYPSVTKESGKSFPNLRHVNTHRANADPKSQSEFCFQSKPTQTLGGDAAPQPAHAVTLAAVPDAWSTPNGVAVVLSTQRKMLISPSHSNFSFPVILTSQVPSTRRADVPSQHRVTARGGSESTCR